MINRKLSFICFVCICLTALFFSGCGGNDGSGTDIGAVGDTGSGTDTGVVGETGGGADVIIVGDTGSGTDTGAVGDTGSGTDTGAVGDTGTGADPGVVGDTGSGTDTGVVGDTGSGTDTGVVGDTGSISTLNVTFSYPVPTDNIQGFRLYIGEDEICETETFPPLTMTCDISGLGITFPATFTMTAFDYDFNESPHSAPFTVNQTAVP